MKQKFEIELTDGSKTEATFITRIKPDDKDVEYIYYSINDDDDDSDNGKVSIFASKLVLEDGKEIIKNLDSEEERQDAYKVFSETYKKIRQENN